MLFRSKWTPSGKSPRKLAAKAKCTEADIQFAEDLRINTLLHRSGLIPTGIRSRSAQEQTTIAAALAELAIREEFGELVEGLTYSRLQRFTASLGRVAGPMAATPLSMEHDAALAAASQYIDRQPALSTEEKTRATDRLMRASMMSRDITRACVGKVYRRKSVASPLPFALTPKLAQLIREQLNTAKDADKEPIGESTDSASVLADWGKLRTDLPPLPLTIRHKPDATKAPQRRASLAGVRIGSLRRLLTDGKAFRRTTKPKVIGGTVLIDASGSMQLSAEHVAEILQHAPAATVAMYSGSRSQGAVTVLAKGGRIASPAAIKTRREEVGGGNIIDGPALRWLAEQQEPRTWVCDGIVTGCHDSSAQNLNREAAALMKRGRITRYASAAQYLRTLKGGA